MFCVFLAFFMTGARPAPAPNIIVEGEEREYHPAHTAQLLCVINSYFSKEERKGEREATHNICVCCLLLLLLIRL